MARLPTELEMKIIPLLTMLENFEIRLLKDSLLSGSTTELMQIITITSSLLLIVKEGNSPKEYQSAVLKTASRVDNLLKRIQNYLSIDDNRNNSSDEIASEIHEIYINMSSIESEIGKIAYNLQQYEMLQARKEIREKISELDKQKKLLEEKQNKSDKIIEALQKESAIKFSEEFANVFSEQAKKHSSRWKGLAQIWLYAGIIMIITLIIVIFIPEFIPFHKAESMVSIILGLNYSLIGITQRLVIISVLIYLIRTSFKHYRINEHLYTLNIHRQNVMNTYRHFEHSLSSQDIETRNILLSELTRSIFSQENTGYLNDSKNDSFKLKNFNPKNFSE
ncbi:MAG: hypothetical protein KAT05_05805 [Spirochaetes bacterium]|nr:hypothetical protein [Spirochaetota bacterium]